MKNALTHLFAVTLCTAVVLQPASAAVQMSFVEAAPVTSPERAAVEAAPAAELRERLTAAVNELGPDAKASDVLNKAGYPEGSLLFADVAAAFPELQANGKLQQIADEIQRSSQAPRDLTVVELDRISQSGEQYAGPVLGILVLIVAAIALSGCANLNYYPKDCVAIGVGTHQGRSPDHCARHAYSAGYRHYLITENACFACP